MIKVEKKGLCGGLEALSPPASSAKILDDAVLSAALALGTPQEKESFNSACPIILRFAENVLRREFPYIQAVDREAIAEDSLVNVWRSLSRFNPEYKGRSWVGQITRNLASSFLRSKIAASRKFTDRISIASARDSAETLEPIDPRTPTPLAALIAAENDSALGRLRHELLETLPPILKATAELRLAGVPPKKIAKFQGVPLGTVKSRLYRIANTGRSLTKGLL